MTNNGSTATQYLAYNQGATTTNQYAGFRTSTPNSAGSQSVNGQQTTQYVTTTTKTLG